jgi:hypothetical protein
MATPPTRDDVASRAAGHIQRLRAQKYHQRLSSITSQGSVSADYRIGGPRTASQAPGSRTISDFIEPFRMSPGPSSDEFEQYRSNPREVRSGEHLPDE